MIFPENPSNRTRDTDEKVDCPPRKVLLFIDPSQKEMQLSKRMRGKYDIRSLRKIRTMETEIQSKTLFVTQVKCP
jgi:hypothetical protein